MKYIGYIGCKQSLVDFIYSCIKDFTKFDDSKQKIIMADVFAGTGSVGAYFRNLGYKVIANDIQYYSYILNKAIIQCVKPQVNLIDELNNLDEIEGFVYKNYCFGSGSTRMYFSDYNGKKCDSIRIELERRRKEGSISENDYYYYLACLLTNIDKLANTTSVYGAYLKKYKSSSLKPLILTPLDIIDGPIGDVYNLSAEKLINFIEGDILYLDPPYNTRQYAPNYHVLETIAKYDNPELKGVTGIRNYDSQKSNFCSKTKALGALDYIIKKAQFKYIFLSYNNEGIMRMEDIQKTLSHYGNYKCYTKSYRRFKADRDDKRNIIANSTVEYLHCLEKI